MDAPRPERIVKRPPKKNFDFNIGAVDREAEKEKKKKLNEEGKDGDSQESSTSPEQKVPEVDPAVVARADQLKRASTEYKILWFLESSYFILLSCVLVIIDVRLSVQDDMSNPALTFMWWSTGIFFVELSARGYFNSVLFDLKAFLVRPLTLLDCFCVFTDLAVFGSFYLSDSPRIDARAINVLRIFRFIKAVDWFHIVSNIRNSACCITVCGASVDTHDDDQLVEEQNKTVDKMRTLGVFLPTETVEAVEPPNEEEQTPVDKAVWKTGKVVRINENSSYTIKYDDSAEFWMECPREKVRKDLREPSAVKEIVDESLGKEKSKPTSWQYKCLKFQESIPFTFVVCVIVFLELFIINRLPSESDREGWGLGVTLFFFAEIVLRLYNFFAVYGDLVTFFTDPLRILDSVLVLIDVVLLAVTLTLGGVSDAKAVKLVRIARLARNAKALRALRSLRALRFLKTVCTCTLPTTPTRTLEMLESVPWTAFIVFIVAGQFLVLSTDGQKGLVDESELTLVNLIIAAFFLVEVSIRLGLYCMLKDDSFAFCKSPVNVIDLCVVFLDVAAIASSLLTLTSVAETSATIKLIRVVRVFRGFRVFHSCRTALTLTGLGRLCPAAKSSDAANNLNEEGQSKNPAMEGGQSDTRVLFTGYRGVKYADGSVYQGHWKEGLEEGTGQLSFPSGDKYKGSFKRGLKHGRGLFLFKNGDQFKGSFSKNLKSGEGEYTWADGDRFSAVFQAGREHGKATFYSTDGRVVDYYFKNGNEVPAPHEEVQRAAVADFKGLSFKDILTPGDNDNASTTL